MNHLTESTGTYDVCHPRFIDEDDACPDVPLEGYVKFRQKVFDAGLHKPDKKCSKCKDTKLKHWFSIDRSEPDGRKDWCRECVKKSRILKLETVSV